ncbi:MAG TPA: glycosyltransferase family 39 protein [Hyphomonadaceae bacterium]|nr:glycosyltransferase family 39 protein [Hyphomonadaceae bacterium]
MSKDSLQAGSVATAAGKSSPFRISDSMRDTIIVGVVAFLSACLVSTYIWENGDIELKWQVIKAWADGQFPAFPENHHNMRWGMTFPAVIWVRLFGDGALNYLLINHVVFALTSAGLYNLVRSLTTPLVAAIAFMVWLINPMAHDIPGNLMPEVWTMAYFVAALILLRGAYAENSRLKYAGAIFMLFLCYGAKETNIFFMPGLGLYELIRRRWTNVGIMIAVFGGGLIVETLTVNAVLSQSHLMLGRAQAIVKAGHLTEMSEDWPYTWSDLFTRWLFGAETNLDRLEYFNKLTYWGFFIITGWKAWTWIKARTPLPPAGDLGPNAKVEGGEVISAAWAMGLSFAFFSSFFILGINPLVLGQPLNDRYLWPLVIPALLILSVALRVGLDRAEKARSGIVAKAQHVLSPLAMGRMALATLVVIGGFCTLARWPIEIAIVKIRRHDYAEPYGIFQSQAYFSEIRQHLLDGCTLVFSRPRPAQTMLVHTFPFKEVGEPLRLYDQSLDGLTIAGHQLRAWKVPESEWGPLIGKLYVAPNNSGFKPWALRMTNAGACTQTYYLGQVDINPRDQLLNGSVGDPPPVVSLARSL